jgi:aspartate/methionine/tyrosine aminotransferase
MSMQGASSAAAALRSAADAANGIPPGHTLTVSGIEASLSAPIRSRIAGYGPHKIIEVVKLALGDPKVIPLWFGESDLPTPEFIARAAVQSLARGETFYTHKRGIPALRQALAHDLTYLYGRQIAVDRVTVTTGGMNALMLTMQMVVNQGDNVLVVSPVWPNSTATANILGADLRPVSLDGTDGRLGLDLDKLFAAADQHTRVIFINSPSNPTGWVMTTDQQRAVLDFCRLRGIWVLAGEVYARLVYDRRAAPSFLEISEPDDPVFVTGSFSKSWAMTGWRMGWLVAPPALGDLIDNLIDYNVSGVPTFLQPAGIVALTEGADFVSRMVEYCRRGRDVVMESFADMPRVRCSRPEATFYAFFQVDGISDSLEFAKRLVREARVGLAPGAAFGPGGEGWFRLCFARSPATMTQAMERLRDALR